MIENFLSDFTNVLHLPKAKGAELNQELLDFVSQYQNHFQSYIFSASSAHFLEKMRPKLVPPFTNIYSSKEMGLSKFKPSSYRRLLKILDCSAQKVLFTDDKKANVEAAQQAGLKTIHFKNTSYFLKKVEEIIYEK